MEVIFKITVLADALGTEIGEVPGGTAAADPGDTANCSASKVSPYRQTGSTSTVESDCWPSSQRAPAVGASAARSPISPK
jgi:hypothetical protein